jgi:hypothetical protein
VPINITNAQPLYIVAEGQSLSSTTGDYIFYFAEVPVVDLVVENHGTVSVTGGAYASAFYTKAEPGYGYFFRNYGALTVTAAGEAQAGEFGRFQNYGVATIASNAPRASEDFLDNYGALYVRGQASAAGLWTYNGDTFTNGPGARMEVTSTALTGGSVGFYLYNGGRVVNQGDLIVSGGAAAVAIKVHNGQYGVPGHLNSSILNTGLIEVTSLDGRNQTIAFDISGTDWRDSQPNQMFEIVNSGTIIAAKAIEQDPSDGSNVSFIPVSLANSGTIRGDIDLGLSAYLIQNTGLIAGDIHVNGGTLVLDSSGGRIDGRIAGVSGASVVHAGLGDNLIGFDLPHGYYLKGDPLIDGGPGFDSVDIVNGFYLRADVTLAYQSPGRWLMTAADGHKATFVDVERLIFRDTDAHLGVTPSGDDANADGKSDVLWRNDSGELYVWNSLAGQGAFLGRSLGNPGTGWHVQDSGDYNGDGKADILWRNDAGDLYVYASNSGPDFTGQSISHVDPVWAVVPQTGDFNGDGRADILFRNSATGEAYVWLSQTGSAAVNFLGQSLGAVPANWSIKGVGDFDGDGRADILWRSDAGDVYLWLDSHAGAVAMTGQSVSSVGNDWSILGLGDFNGDGRDDILWRHAGDGELYVWNSQLGSPAVNFLGQSLGLVGLDWTVAAIGDYDGDGRADVLFRNADGRVYVWNSNDTGLVGFQGQGLGQTPTDWHILSDFHGM